MEFSPPGRWGRYVPEKSVMAHGGHRQAFVSGAEGRRARQVARQPLELTRGARFAGLRVQPVAGRRGFPMET